MSHVNEIIVLDDDEDEKTPQPAKAKACDSSKQSNGKEEGGSSQQSKADVTGAKNKALFNEFVEFCLEWTLDHPEVITFLQGRYAKAKPSYLNSVEFQNTLVRCLDRVKTKKSKIFVYINELCTALKANSQKRKVTLQTTAVRPPVAEKTETPTENDGEYEDVQVKKTGSKRQIRYLENLLRIYSLEIKKLQEKELGLDELDDEDSSYIQESRLKRKLLRIFEKLCEIKDCSSLTGRVIEQRILYRGTRYPEINRRLEKFINSSRDLFPDYGDVLRVVERANDKHKLGLSRKQMQSMAQDAFRELGNKLQDRRHLDMIYNFGCHLTDPYKSVNDPAQMDSGLSRRLRENRNTAMSRLEDIIKKYAELQDDGEEGNRMQTRRGPERNKQPSSDESEEEEEEEESEDSETDIEEELEQSQEVPDSEEGENEEEIPADQENDADQKMEMASGGEDDGGKDKEDADEQEEATELESSPTSTSLSHDKDSPNTTVESEAEAQLSGSPDPTTPGSSDSPNKVKSDDEHREEPEEVCETTTNTGDQTEENLQQGDSLQSSADTGLKEAEAENVRSNCSSPSDIEEDAGKHKSATKYLFPDMTVSLVGKNKDSPEQDADNVTEAREDSSCEESDAGNDSEPSRSPALDEESRPDGNTEEPCVRRKSTDSEAAGMEEEPACMDTAEKPDDDGEPVEDDEPVDDKAASGDDRTSESPEMEDTATETADLDTCQKQKDLSPLGGSNGVHMFTHMRSTALNRLKLNKDRDSPKRIKTEKDSPVSHGKRKGMSPENWTRNNGLTRYNGKEYTEDHIEKSSKKAKMDCSNSSASSSSESDSDDEDERTPGLMMTCSPRETPKKSSKKSHVSTQCDPDEVIVLSD